MISYPRIRSYVKLAETCDIKITAEQLNISQQGLIKQIHTLEQDLDLKLYEKFEDKQIDITKDGIFIYESLKPIVKQVTECITKIEAYKQRKFEIYHS